MFLDIALVDVAAIRRLAAEALEILDDPVAEGFVHGDLIPGNLLVDGSKLTAVIDWGDLTAGDPANDGAAIWMLYSRPEDRVRALEAAGRADDEAFIARSRAWGILFGVTMLDAGAINDPSLADVGRAILANVVS